MQSLGFPQKERVIVEIDSTVKDNAYYDPVGNRIVLGEHLAGDSDVAFWVYASFALSSLTKDTSWPGYTAIANGLADYLVCSFTNNTLIGEKSTKQRLGFDQPYLRNLDNDRKFSEVSRNKDPNPYKDPILWEAWGGAFWDIRRALGQATADKLLFSTWIALRPSAMRGDYALNFVTRLLEVDRSLEGGKHASQIRAVFERRGMKF
jgi:hypothetical protein